MGKMILERSAGPGLAMLTSILSATVVQRGKVLPRTKLYINSPDMVESRRYEAFTEECNRCICFTRLNKRESR